MTRRILVWIIGLWWLAVGAVAGFACSGSVEETKRTGGQEADTQSSGNTDNSENIPKTTVYSDEEVGVDALVDEELADRHLYVRHRTDEERHDEMLAEQGHVLLLPVEERDRLFFEQQVDILFSGVRGIRQEEIERIERTLDSAFYDSVDICIGNSEWPDAVLHETANGEFDFGHYGLYEASAELYDLTWEDYVDLRHECSKFAASYPVLDREYRDELLKTRRDYYLEFLRLWMRDHPEMVVPLDYENSVNQPYQDYVRRQCMEAEDPAACARGEGVSYP